MPWGATMVNSTISYAENMLLVLDISFVSRHLYIHVSFVFVLLK